MIPLFPLEAFCKAISLTTSSRVLQRRQQWNCIGKTIPPLICPVGMVNVASVHSISEQTTQLYTLVLNKFTISHFKFAC